MTIRTDFKARKVAAWPTIDRRLWEAARFVDDLDDDENGAAANWRLATIVNVEWAWGTHVDWLDRQGLLDPEQSPVERVARDLFKRFMAAYGEGHARSSCAAIARGLYDFVRVTCPDAAVAHLSRRHLREKRRSSPTKAPAERMRPVSELLAIGDDLITRGLATMGETPVRGAIEFRNGVIFLMEVGLPLRVSNLAALRIGETLVKEGDRWRATFPGAAMKGRLAHDGWYPAFLTTTIEQWIDEVRPILLRNSRQDDDGAMWLGRRGEPIGTHQISRAVRDAIRDRTGIPVSVHGFRRSAVTQAAISDPKHAVEIGGALLAHASPTSTEIYDLARGFEAQQVWLELLGQMRAEDAQG